MFLAKIIQQVIRTFLQLSSCQTHFLYESVDRTLIMIRFPVAYSIHSCVSSSYTSGYCQIILLVYNMSCAIFRSEKLELLLQLELLLGNFWRIPEALNYVLILAFNNINDKSRSHRWIVSLRFLNFYYAFVHL